jgi:predicted porin
MKGLGLTAAATAMVVIMGGAGAVEAADLATKAPVLKAPGDAPCSSILDFFTTACQVTAYGVRFYGTVDVGFGYQTHGAPFDRNFVTGASYFIQKMNRQAMWGIAPNGLSQSNIGVQITEPLGGGWKFVGQLEAGFDPYSLQLSSSPGSEWQNRGVPIGLQTTNGDSTRAGQFYNGLGFAGISHETWGTLTFGRQNSFTADGVSAYDPMGGSYAFSPIGFSGLVAGGGDTEDSKYSTALKYRVNIGNFRLGAIGMWGGYDLDNGAKSAVGGTVGGDFRVGPGTLSVDAIAAYNEDAVNLGLGSNPTPTNAITATISNNTNVMLLAKYTINRLKLYAGYEWMQFAPPSDPGITSFVDIAGNPICANTGAGSCGATNFTAISTTDFVTKDKILQVAWAGARYSVTDSVDVAAAYYHYDQNQYKNIDCASPNSNGACAGTMDAASIMVDWKFAPKWDTYVGTFFSQMNGGLDAGYLARSNLATTAGVRFRW